MRTEQGEVRPWHVWARFAHGHATPVWVDCGVGLANRDYRLLDVPPHIQTGPPPGPANRLRHGPQPGVSIDQPPHLRDGHVCKSTEVVVAAAVAAAA